MCHSIAVVHALQQGIPNHGTVNACTAKSLGPGERLSLGVQALAGQRTITGLANGAGVSRKFVSGQRDRARAALEIAFATRDAVRLMNEPSSDRPDQ